ncbi:hypothetical protein Pan241w_52900 [Gimesia alba]|uniref:Uncharacterized protein n=1 Tax=Gimesia alba TaxID=2527973 RepID=A0A517RMR3_9PLAN|nr:hypothetical protein [Gimesia alba]QDT45171.1 hypothetical protein Pan241w_52900 [Gimesia alba]
MNVTITQYHSTETCTWCEKNKECVTTDFDDGFIGKAPLCWSCLQKAIKVRSRQAGSKSAESETKPVNKSN